MHSGVDLHIRNRSLSVGERRGEPVTCGVPWPPGVLRHADLLGLEDSHGSGVAVQARTLDRWPDDSVRWLLLDWQAHAPENVRYHAHVLESPRAISHATPLKAEQNDRGATVDTGAAIFEIQPGRVFPFVIRRTEELCRAQFALVDAAQTAFEPRIDSIAVYEQGPLRVCIRSTGGMWHGNVKLLDVETYLHFYAGSAAVRFSLTLRNERRARHPGGLWDLGAGGSVFIRDASLSFKLPVAGETARLSCSPEPGLAFDEYATPFELYQDSSGGANWKSHNHWNRDRVVPNSFCGYRVRSGASEAAGKRANPVVYLSRGNCSVAAVMPQFWQNFPKAIEASNADVVLRLFPRQYADVHELQGGEQKTHEFTIAFGRDAMSDVPLAWAREPLAVHAQPSWYADTKAIPYLTPCASDHNTAYLRLVDAVIDGTDSFFAKRERIDEYGWRHFGDIYADHESVFHRGPEPFTSHYNNQYDPLAGFAYQYLRSADLRWRDLMNDLAMHVRDIDIYHTTTDKSAYNHGLFWHTYHYIDADTGTHRSYPRASRTCGGGPSDEHNYTTGLMLHHFLTGDPQSREAALTLAQWVIDMDDGRQTVFRWLDRGCTGLASQTASPDYHGPGRGAGNSINALLDAYRLTGHERFRGKLERIVRRSIHPADDISARTLLDAERRWSYTVFLQALGRYLDFLAERGSLGDAYAYARASLLHYARWMADNEYPYLEKPQRLQFPTETWPAQDMRKSEVFKYAMKHAQGDERQRFWERAEFFFEYVTRKLMDMPTRTLTRPMVLLLSYGFMHAYFQQHFENSAPLPKIDVADFGRPVEFVPQKGRAKKRLLAIVAAVTALFGVALCLLFI